LGRLDPRLWVKAQPELGSARVQNLRLSSYLDAPDTPRLAETMSSMTKATSGFLRTSRYFLRLAKSWPPIDGVLLLVVAETRRHHMRRSLWTNGR
jgi:hypothetical protein